MAARRVEIDEILRVKEAASAATRVELGQRHAARLAERRAADAAAAAAAAAEIELAEELAVRSAALERELGASRADVKKWVGMAKALASVPEERQGGEVGEPDAT